MNWKLNVLQTVGKVRVMYTYVIMLPVLIQELLTWKVTYGNLYILQKINISVIDLAIYRKCLIFLRTSFHSLTGYLKIQ